MTEDGPARDPQQERWPFARPWRGVPPDAPANSYLRVRSTPERLVVTSPGRWPFIWLPVPILIAALVHFDPTLTWPLPAAALSIAAVIAVLWAFVLPARLARLCITVDRERWSAVQRRMVAFGPFMRYQSASGRTSDLLGAKVASGGTDSSEFVAELKFLEATNAKTAYRAMAPLWGLPPACRMLTLGELEWLAAAVNRFVETHMARSVPPRVENDLAVATSGAVVPVATLEHPHVANSGGGAANAAPATPLLCGGVPFARPRAAAPCQPPQHSGLRVVHTAAGTITVHLPRPDALALVTRIVLYGALGVYEGFLTLAAPARVYLAGQLIFAVCCFTVACLAARTLAAPNALVLRPQEWVLRQAGALWHAQARWPFGGNFHIAERGVLDGITGCKVVAHAVTLPRARTLWTRHGAATGCLCLAYADGSERPLPLRSAGLSLDALQHLAALFNAHISAATPPEHELELSVLADLDTAAACAHAASAAAPRGAPPPDTPEATQVAALRAWSALGSESLAALAALPRLHSRRVRVTSGPSGLSVAVTPDAAARRGKVVAWGHCTCTAGVACILAAAVSALQFWRTNISPGAADAYLAAAATLHLTGVALVLLYFAGSGVMWVPRRVEITVGPRGWRVRAWLRASILRVPPFHRAGRGELDDLLGCQVVAQRRLCGGNTTQLQLRSRRRTIVLNRSPFEGLTLREKVSVMREVNLYLAQVKSGGEACGGIDAPLLS